MIRQACGGEGDWQSNCNFACLIHAARLLALAIRHEGKIGLELSELNLAGQRTERRQGARSSQRRTKKMGLMISIPSNNAARATKAVAQP